MRKRKRIENVAQNDRNSGKLSNVKSRIFNHKNSGTCQKNSSDVSSYLSKDAEFDQARSSGGRRVVISNVRKHSNRTVTRNISDEANRLNAKNFVVASDGLENEQENVLLPQHPVFPDIISEFVQISLVVAKLIHPACSKISLDRFVRFVLRRLDSRPSCYMVLFETTHVHHSRLFIHVLAFYSRLTLTHLIYPCVFYILLFYNEIVQMFSQYDQPLFARLFNCLSDSGHADYKSLIHACSVVPSQIREEVDVFISDVYNRLKQCLFAAFTTAYYAVFIPCGFAPAYLYIDYVWVAEMSFIVFLTSGTLYLTYLFPIQLCDQLHRAAMHLGKWVYTKSYRFPQTNQKIWSETSLWPDGSMVRMNRHVYRGVGLSIAAQPDNDDHRRYHIMFGDPLRVINILCLASGFLILSQFLLLVHSTEWQHVLTLVLLMFANYVLLFKVFKDKIILGRIYYPSMTHTKLKLK
ncbi:Transmembrane protein 39A [Trichinella spiralis]|uniref:Transmembrane protein 39A n=1 Tax=Trichinella spiralis TaxID=6334 RepID=A0ABR3KB09_TRISP